MAEIKDMTIEEVEVRTLEIQAEVDSADETRQAELKTELDALEERKAELKKIAAEAKETREMVAEGKADIEEVKTVIQEEKRMTNSEIVASVEYRDAFAKYIRTGDDKECRALLTENVSGDVPVASIVYDIVKNAWESRSSTSRVMLRLVSRFPQMVLSSTQKVSLYLRLPQRILFLEQSTSLLPTSRSSSMYLMRLSTQQSSLHMFMTNLHIRSLRSLLILLSLRSKLAVRFPQIHLL